MKEWTGADIQRAQQGLEQAAAVVLGRMLFEFARLDMELGLALVWSDGGKQMEMRTKEVEQLSFHDRLDGLKNRVGALYDVGHRARAPYDEWLRNAHSVRLMRNELVHGRWGIDAVKDEVFNVIGLPTSSSQRAKSYAISDLKRVLEQMQGLQKRLSVLREEWPL